MLSKAEFVDESLVMCTVRYPRSMTQVANESLTLKVFDEGLSTVVQGGESTELVVSSSLNIRLYQVIPAAIYYPSVVEVVGENFTSECTCQLSL